MKQILMILGFTLFLNSCQKKKSSSLEETTKEDSICHIGGKRFDCETKKTFDLVYSYVDQLEFYDASKNRLQEVVETNDSILALIKPFNKIIERVKDSLPDYAYLFLGNIEKTTKRQIEYKKIINAVSNVKIVGKLKNHPSNPGEKLIEYYIENNSNSAFSTLVLTTKFFDKDNELFFTDDNDAIGTTGFMPEMNDDLFPVGYKGSYTNAPVLGLDENLHSKIARIEQEITNVIFY